MDLTKNQINYLNNKEKYREYYQKNKEKLKEKSREYMKNNREKIVEYQRNYYAKNFKKVIINKKECEKKEKHFLLIRYNITINFDG